MSGAYYNENDAYAAQWLRNLIAAGLIPAGDVDERSIVDVRGSDIAGYTQCHFFAGLGGWCRALRLAGWPNDRPVWTGSCPCQPFSVAGKRKGFADERHLWPEFRRLIAERRPATVFGEQTAQAPDWLRLVRGDLEALGYAVGAIPVEAASAGAHHFRDRYWFVANSDHGQCRQPERQICAGRDASNGNSAGTLADSDSDSDSDSERAQIPFGQPGNPGPEQSPAARGDLRLLVNDPSNGWGEGWTEHEFRSRGFTASVASIDGCQYLECPDGKWRRLPPPRVRWLGARIFARVDRLRAIGNAIDYRPAVEVIQSFMEIKGAKRSG
jgi:DNA (cytosine-5)-methyltransferase 1